MRVWGYGPFFDSSTHSAAGTVYSGVIVQS
jgi:hypothetical protein